jgi:uncharacterized protein YceK
MLIGLFASIHETFVSPDYVDSAHGTFGYKSKVYAGVKREAAVVSICFEGTGWEFVTCPFAILAAVGMPASFVADSLFLPYTFTGKQRNEEQHRRCIENKRNQAFEAQKNGVRWEDSDFWCAKAY